MANTQDIFHKDVPSEAGDIAEERGDGAPVAGGQEKSVPPASRFGGGLFSGGKTAASLKGRGPVLYDPRKLRYDVTRGKGVKMPFEVSRDDRMSAVAAGVALHNIHEKLGIATETEATLYAFDSALFFCHTVNGGSTLVPGRSTFRVPGVTQEFSYSVIRDILGVDQRRFFRAFADEIMEVNKRVLREYDPYDVVKAEQWNWLMQVATDRGLQRYPYLAHDSADACTMNTAERSALAQSKVLVISSVNNSVDKLRANSRTASADGYDSTVGTATA